MRLVMVVAILVVFLCGFSRLSGRAVEAAADSIGTSQKCAGDKVNVSFRWEGNDPSAREQWLDISTLNNGWRAGTFTSAGPLANRTQSYIWNGLEPNTNYYVRINQQLPDGRWDASRTIKLTSACGSVVAAEGTEFAMVGFADHRLANGSAPADPTAAGGVLQSCNPERLFSFVKIGALKEITGFSYVWSFNGSPSAPSVIAYDTGGLTASFSITNNAAGWQSGEYGFKLYSGGDANKQLELDAKFTLTC